MDCNSSQKQRPIGGINVSSKSVNLFLIDGKPIGRIKCTIANWTGIGYKIPRTEIENCHDRKDLSQSGVYFLFGTDEMSGKPVVYVGQAGIRKNGEGVLGRLLEHNRSVEKDYWNEAVIFTTQNDSFGPTEISYLEHMFCKIARQAERYIVKNGNEPTSGNITEEKESELKEFIDYAKVIMVVLGHKVFEPLVEKNKVYTGETEMEIKERVELFCNERNVMAKCIRTAEGFVLIKGSLLAVKPTKSCAEGILKKRQQHADKIDEKGELLEDILFNSPSGAISFATFSSRSGYTSWKTIDGITLKDLLK